MNKLCLVVRKDLKMYAGKIAAQCCHATIGILKKNKKYKIKMWSGMGEKIVVLKCKDAEEMYKIQCKAKLNNISTYLVMDAGLTEVEPGTVTVLAIGIEIEDKLNLIISNLKLL